MSRFFYIYGNFGGAYSPLHIRDEGTTTEKYLGFNALGFLVYQNFST